MTQIQVSVEGGGGLETYVLPSPHVLISVVFPVEGCLERLHNPVILRDHCMYRQCKSKIVILQEVQMPLPQCSKCRMHMPEARLWRHRHTARCDRAM